MKRPIITEFLGDGIELEEAHKIYKFNPELWSYIQAQDKHIDYVESQLKESEKAKTSIKGEMKVLSELTDFGRGKKFGLQRALQFLTSNPK